MAISRITAVVPMKFSQREARRNWKRLQELEREIEHQRRAWSQGYFGATHIAIASWSADSQIPTAIGTARKLNHAVVCVGSDSGEIRFMALPHPKISQ